MSKFQIILLVVFGVFIIAGVMVFSFAHNNSKAVAQIQIWGPFPASDFQNFMNTAGLYQDNTMVLNYTQVSPETFDAQFTEALAEGRGPDLVIIGQDFVWQERNKLALISYGAVKQSDFESTFVDEGSILEAKDGIYGLPMVVDPMVLFTNKDLFNSAALPTPPSYWDEIYSYADKLTSRDGAGNIIKSAIALGEASNIPHAKEILSMLMLQAGTPIVDLQGDRPVSELTNNFQQTVAPAESALNYYTQFANPAKPFYSWNRALANAEQSFISGDSAMYLGFASEMPTLRAKNPNLNLGVFAVPQSRIAGKTVTYGKLYAVAIVRNSPDQTADFTAATKLVSATALTALSNVVGLPPARRDLLSQPGGAGAALFYPEALQAQGWLDPNPDKTRGVFADMISAVTSGRASVGNALGTANNALLSLINSQ